MVGEITERMLHYLTKTIDEEMRNEAQYLQSHYAAREAIMEIIEMPNQQADRVIRSIEQNKGVLSGALSNEIPVLAQGDNWSKIVTAVDAAFGGRPIRFSVQG